MPVILERRIPRVTAVLLGTTLALSIAAAIDARHGGELGGQLALVPRAIWRGQLWRLASWPFVQGGLLCLIFACVALYVFGPDLELAWGRRRYHRFVVGVALAAGVGTSLLALVLPGAWWYSHLGGMALADAVVIAWARQFPDQPVSIYLIVVVRGPALVWIIVATAALRAAFWGVVHTLPELLAIAAALLYMDRAPRRLWLRLRLL